MRYIFVGERQSPKAFAIGATWQNGRMAARTLHNALRAVGLDPNAQEYVNLWQEPGLGAPQASPCPRVLAHLRALAGRQDVCVVAMGALVQQALTQARVPFLPMVHPAARGRIRRRERFIAHVRATLFPVSGSDPE